MSTANAGRLLFFGLAGAIIAFVVAPLAVVVVASFFEDKILTFPPSGYTLTWYVRAWSLSEFSNGFILSLKIAVLATAASVLVGVPAALAIERFPFPGREWVRQLLLAPFYVPAIVAGAAIYLFFIQVEVSTELRLAGSLAGLAIAHTVVSLPWVMRLVCVSLVMSDRAGEEAARSLGATPLQVFFMVTVPAIRPGIVAGGLFAFIISFGEFEKSLFLIGPGQQTLPTAIVSYLQWSLDPTIAAVSTVQIAIIAIAMALSNRYVQLGKAL